MNIVQEKVKFSKENLSSTANPKRIAEYYENYNFPASEKLYRLLKKDGHNFKKKDIEDFLLKQKEHEMLKVKQ